MHIRTSLELQHTTSNLRQISQECRGSPQWTQEVRQTMTWYLLVVFSASYTTTWHANNRWAHNPTAQQPDVCCSPLEFFMCCVPSTLLIKDIQTGQKIKAHPWCICHKHNVLSGLMESSLERWPKKHMKSFGQKVMNVFWNSVHSLLKEEVLHMMRMNHQHHHIDKI